MVCGADLAIEFPLVTVWELNQGWGFCEVALGVGGKGIMQRPAGRWGQDPGPGLLQTLFYTIKVEKRRKFQDWLPSFQDLDKQIKNFKNSLKKH